tara:strand:+ start:1356 stop:1544 length:189 start_codon:yes stop_codon:yes gene_type:complete
VQVGDLVKHRYRSPEMVGVVMKLWTETLGQNWAEKRYQMCKIYWNDHSVGFVRQKNVEVIDG